MAALGIKGLFEWISDCKIDIDIFKWGFILRIEKEDKSEWGWVTILGEQDYQWRSEEVGWNERICYVKIDVLCQNSLSVQI